MTNWEEKDNSLVREFTFADFDEAWAFMNKVAEVAEQMNHHPNWSNVYNQVKIELNTHDAGGIVTDRDRALAEAINKILGE